MQRQSALAATILALALAGCWKSDQPLMSAADRDSVSLTGTWSDDGDGGSTPKVYRLVPGADRLVAAQQRGDAGWADEYTLSLDWLDSETYLVQAVNKDGRPVYQLLLGDPGRDELKLVTLACTSEVTAGAPGIKVVDGDCVFAGYPALRTAAEAAAGRIVAGDSAASESTVIYRRIES